jgi:hypothetical protein
MLHLAVLDMENTLHQMEIHVFIHICLLQALAGHTRSQEETGLDVYTVPPVLLVRQTFSEEGLVPLQITLRSYKLIHLLLCFPGREKVELLERKSFQRRSVSLFSVDYETDLALHFRTIGSD